MSAISQHAFSLKILSRRFELSALLRVFCQLAVSAKLLETTFVKNKVTREVVILFIFYVPYQWIGHLPIHNFAFCRPVCPSWFVVKKKKYYPTPNEIRRSQWPRGLRRRSTAARLLKLWVRIPAVAWMFVVSVVCCQVEVSATSWSLVQRSPTDCDASLCMI